MRLRITDIRDHSIREVDLSPDSCDMAGWQDGISGWAIGPKGSGAAIELDEPLGECHVGVFNFTFQLLLWGVAKQLPNIWLYPIGRPPSKLLPLEPERWLLVEREDLRRVAMGGDVRLRIDLGPIRFGNYIIESLGVIGSTDGCCAHCNEPLRMYYRVGTEQVCPDCTEKLKQKRGTEHAGIFRRAVYAGVAAAVAGGAIHWFLLASLHVSVGSILIGVLVGFAMRVASKDTTEPKHSRTAIILTLVAGSLSWWLSQGSLMSALYLAIGVIVAWRITARYVPLVIHGPYQSKARSSSDGP